MHQGRHALFYNPQAELSSIQTNQRLADLCQWANIRMTPGLDKFLADPTNWYEIANLVKINLWIADIRKQGIIKPWLIQDLGNGIYITGTGETRLRALERIPEIQSVPAFISTATDRAYLYRDLTPVTSFDQFAAICNAVQGQTFLFKYTDQNAAYGLYWYEYDSELTRSVTPNEADCVSMFARYLVHNPQTVITPEWFDVAVDWNSKFV